jgi:hypothetical protein
MPAFEFEALQMPSVHIPDRFTDPTQFVDVLAGSGHESAETAIQNKSSHLVVLIFDTAQPTVGEKRGRILRPREVVHFTDEPNCWLWSKYPCAIHIGPVIS